MFTMRWWFTAAVLSGCCLQIAVLTETAASECLIELSCAECLPEHMPLVATHRAAGGKVRASEGDEVMFSCGRGKFLAWPLLSAVAARCRSGRYEVRGAATHLLEMGCQESIFEDVLHHVDQCPSPLQGRAYQVQEEHHPRHLALLCFDADKGIAALAHACNAAKGALPLRAHAEPSHGPLSLLGNFNHMFDAKTRADAERLYGDDAAANRRLRELLKHDDVSLAGQALTSARLLGAEYFEDQDARVAEFASNKFPAWRSVAEGNLRHLQRDVGALLRRARGNATLHVLAGAHEVLGLRKGAAGGRAELFLRAGRRFPVPRFVWTVVSSGRRAVALVLLNDPFVAVSEVRAAVFCESFCSRLEWASALRRARRYEAPLYGLVFCCEVHELAARVPALPADLFRDVPRGTDGLLTDV